MMRKKVTIRKIFLTLFILTAQFGSPLFAVDAKDASKVDVNAFSGQDLIFSGKEAATYNLNAGGNILVFSGDFQLSISDSQFNSDQAVIWLERTQTVNEDRTTYIRAYLQGNVSEKKAGIAASDLINRGVTTQGQEMVLWFASTGSVFIEAGKKQTADPRGLELYSKAYTVLNAVGIVPNSAETQPQSLDIQAGKSSSTSTSGDPVTEKNDSATGKTDDKNPSYTYPVTISSIGSAAYDVHIDFNSVTPTVTVIGRFYLSQQQDEDDRLLELQADSAVIFLLSEQSQETQEKDLNALLAGGEVRSVYLFGDVVMTEGQRTIRADEIYYDFQGKKALANNVEMRTFYEKGNIPIYLRATKLRQLAENQFTAEEVTLTTSEFHTPQVSFNASEIKLIDTASNDGQEGTSSSSKFDAQMRDVRFKYYNNTLLYLPLVRGSMLRPDVPLKSVHVGNDNTYGTYVETRWYLARILGLSEPPGTDSTLLLDYYDERGTGGGIATSYQTEEYFGHILGYIISDSGEDTLGRQRKDLEPPRELRGRFSWQHRQFLPYDWQFTTEASYLSDENFLESFYRTEYGLEKDQETLIYLKRIQENRAFTILSKVRINNFLTQLEELPSSELHWTGESFLDDKLTFYSDSQISRLRQRYSSSGTVAGSEEYYSFLTTRNEVDLPFSVGRTRVVPFAAINSAYEDGMGFYRKLDGEIASAEDAVWLGETGVRVTPQPFWKVNPGVKSEIFDLDQMRHVVRPYVTAAGYTQNNSVFEQRDMVNAGVAQQLQTKRGPQGNRRTVDWMRLDTSITFVNDSDPALAGAERFIWNKPYIPVINELSSTVPQQDRRGSSNMGVRTNSVTADYIWHVTDSTAVLSDMNYDLQNGIIQQFNLGFSRMRWPNLSYYLGSRYLKRIDNGYGQKGSNALTFALTYLLDPRYTLVYATQFDLDYESAVRNDITLIRQYHRLFWAITYSTDESLDRQSVAISLWPQGVPDLAIGSNRYMSLGGSAGF
jgi:hypothetical protein